MTGAPCGAPLALGALIDYWLGEVGEGQETRVDEHLLGCEACAANLASLVELADGIRAAVREGAVQAVASEALLERLSASGLRLRQYRVPWNGSVHCTVAPNDDVMVARLQAPLAEVEHLDALLVDSDGREQERLYDVPFDRTTGEIVLIPRIGPIRASGPATSRIVLVARDRGGERTVGEYTFMHTPWGLSD